MTLSRRLFLAASMAGAVAMAGGVARAQTNVAYVRPNGAGKGTSWDDAANIMNIPALADMVGPGGTIAILADGEYAVEDTIDLSGAEGVTIAGYSLNMSPRAARIVGTRRGWSGGAVDAEDFGGNTLFRVSSNISGLSIANLDVRDVGRVVDLAGSGARDMTIENVSFTNIRDGIFTDDGSSVRSLAIRNFSGRGYSKKGIRFHGSSSGWVIENCDLDSGQQYGDDFAVGIECNDSANGLQILGGSTGNSLDRRPEDKYWNGDGVASERGNRNIVIQNHRSYGNSDGGYDLKSEATQLINCVSEGNKRNYRIWGGINGTPIQLIGCRSVNPVDRGGNGGSHHMWLRGEESDSPGAAHVLWENGSLSGGRTETAIYAEGNDVDVHLVNTDTSGLGSSTKLFESTADSSQLRQD
jgi:hypothetical protein